METIANSFSYGAGRQPGARREKVKSYLRAANELRQTYQREWQSRAQDEDTEGMPGGYPEVDVVRSGNEEMVLFPSYARKHFRKQSTHQPTTPHVQPGADGGIEQQAHTGDAAYWMAEWERYEDANAIVDVDVRGWIYAPQHGPLNRKNRLLIAVARRLSGVPAPDGQSPPPEPTTHSQRVEYREQQREELAAKKEADHIAEHGEKAANAAARGRYSVAAVPTLKGLESGSAPGSRSASPGSMREVGTSDYRSLTDTEDASDEEVLNRALQKRESWKETTNMSREELHAANHLLLTRLKPFMHLPMINMDITIFFFNDNKSQSKLVRTNDSGHFNVRAALNFVPTHVRVLASDKLSATEPVYITDPQGISLISDIDDTIKHSAISNGAREIFKNTFIRQLEDLTIDGVKEWYGKMYDLGVKIHYVSNSPWQLYPLLKSYFHLAGLPDGSFHLKRYTGMLQGVFEPAAERKKGSIDRIMHDFPSRKFILVGDSGEADLEVYTEAVMNYPGRVLAVFIRDVTTPPKKNFFDPTFSNRPKDPGITAAMGDNYKWKSDLPADRPALPARHKTDSVLEQPNVVQEGNLIEFGDDDDPTGVTKTSSFADDLKQLQVEDKPQTSKPSKAPPPPPPNKPSNLRSFTTQVSSPLSATPQTNTPTNNDRTQSEQAASSEKQTKKSPPPPPPRRAIPQQFSSSIDQKKTIENTETVTHNYPKPPTRQRTDPATSQRDPREDISPSETPDPGSRWGGIDRVLTTRSMDGSSSNRTSQNGGQTEDDGYIAGARRQLMSAYNALPSIRPAAAAREAFANATSAPGVHDRTRNTAQPPRRNYGGGTSSAVSRWATGASGGDPSAGGGGGAPPGSNYNKKEEIWKRRWAQSEEIMKKNGVVLRTWRVGSDVMDECVRLVERSMKESEGYGRRGGVSID